MSRMTNKDNHLTTMNRFIDSARLKLSNNPTQMAEIDKLVVAANAQDEAFFVQLTADLGWDAPAQKIAQYINRKTSAVVKA